MKKLLLALSILFCISSFSQPYLPMLEEGNVWNTVTYNYPEPVSITNQTYEITGQVIIGGFTYYSVTNHCLMREENGKVYSYNEIEGIYELLFDFTLEIGDEIFLDSNNQPGCFTIGGNYFDGEPIIVSNTSTQFIAGDDRKVIELEYQDTPVETWIEGIGSLNGIYPFEFTHFDAGSSLSCFTNNGITYYFNGFTECIILGTIDFNKDSIKLSPNPVTANSTIQFPIDTEIQLIKIFDVFGRLVKNEKTNSDYVIINAEAYTSGIYIYQLFSKNKMVKTDKFIVK